MMQQDFDHVEGTGNFRTLLSSSTVEDDEVRERSGRRLLAVGTSASDQNALLQFKQSVSDPNRTLQNWNITLNANYCNWTGVTCSNATIRRVVYLNLTGENLLVWCYHFISILWKFYKSNVMRGILQVISYMKRFQFSAF